MAIRVRRGNEADFDESKMLPGEWAVSLDTRYVRMCFAPGVCLRMATYEGFESDMERVESILTEVESIEEAIKVIQRDINANVDIAIEQKELASGYAEQSKEYARQAKESAERAAEVSDISYGSSDRAGIVAPQDIYVNPSNGHMELIATASASPLQNSFNGGLRFTEMIGKSEQNTTTGKNLLPVMKGTTSNSLVGTVASDGTVSFTGTPTSDWANIIDEYATKINLNASDSFIFSIDSAKTYTVGIKLRVPNEQPKTYKITSNKLSVTITPNIDGECYVSAFLENITSGTSLKDSFKPMLRLSSVADDTWEACTGGKPAPNPDYPQEIKSVSISEMQTHGKNLLKNEATITTADGITFAVNSDGTVTANGTATANVFLDVKKDIYLEKGKSYILNGCPVNGTSTTYFMYLDGKNSRDYGEGVSYTEQDGSRTKITIAIRSGVKADNLVFKPMLRYAEITDDTFQPFQESVVTPTGFKLNAIGNVKDRLIKKDGLWQVERKIKSYTFTGNETGWNISATYVGSVWIDFVNKIGLPKAIYGAGSWCSHFQIVPLFSNYTRYGQAVVEVAGFNMWMKDGTVSGESEVKEFLKNNNVTLLYVTETPTIEILPLADQVALNSLLTFDGVTYLDIESVVEPQFELEYGTSKVGGYTLQSLNIAEANQARIVAMETVTNNMAAAVLQGEE